MSTSSIVLEFGKAVHGWLPCRFIVEHFTLECEASHVCNDPLGEFVELLVAVEDLRTDRHIVELWLEPQLYVLEVTNIREAVLRMRVLSYQNMDPPSEIVEGFEVKLDRLIDSRHVAGVLKHALADCFDRNGQVNDDHWQWIRNSRSSYRWLMSRYQ